MVSQDGDSWRNLIKALRPTAGEALPGGITHPVFAQGVYFSLIPLLFYKQAFDFLKRRGLLEEFLDYASSEKGQKEFAGYVTELGRVFVFTDTTPPGEVVGRSQHTAVNGSI